MLLGTIRGMHTGYGERWIKLCDEALEEDESSRLMELIQVINKVIEQKQRYLRIWENRNRSSEYALIQTKRP